jgi:hypothetical protein
MEAQYAMEARDFLRMLVADHVRADLVLLDPPYSPRQISECYAAAGKKCGSEETQNGRLLREVRDLVRKLISPTGIVISCGWNSVGMGKQWAIEELLLVCHGGAHNDTICMVQRAPGAAVNIGLFGDEA